jgi:hypothetical protein
MPYVQALTTAEQIIVHPTVACWWILVTLALGNVPVEELKWWCMFSESIVHQHNCCTVAGDTFCKQVYKGAQHNDDTKPRCERGSDLTFLLDSVIMVVSLAGLQSS